MTETQRLDRLLPNDYLRYFMQAVESETGIYTLRMMLLNAGLDRYLEELPPRNRERVIQASKFAALQKAIREYFGSGARGSLNRIGHLLWSKLLENASVTQRVKVVAARALPVLPRSRTALEYLAARMSEPDGKVSVHLLDKELIFVDTSSDSTYGQEDEQPVCWATLGAIQAALFWASGEEQDVEEISCRATGADSCKFRIRALSTKS
jgi:predicted hydrocarbon binding protein